MRNVIMVVTFAAVVLGTAYGQVQSQPSTAASLATVMPNPPFDVYVNTKSEKDGNELTVIYHANGTFVMRAGGSRGGAGAGSPRQGKWWWQDGKFCFSFLDDQPSLVPACKNNGHYIGRTPYTTQVTKTP